MIGNAAIQRSVSLSVFGCAVLASVVLGQEPSVIHGRAIPLAGYYARQESKQPPESTPTAPQKKQDTDGDSKVAPRESPLPPADQGAVGTYAFDWATLVELAQASGIEIGLAQAKLREAEAGIEVAQKEWIPSLSVGISWLHHDGFIQEIDGRVINANKNSAYLGPLVRGTIDIRTVKRDILKAQQLARIRCAQVRRASQQHFQDVSLAFVDLQSAQAGAAIYTEAILLLEDIVSRTRQFEKAGLMAPFEITAYENQVRPQRIALMGVRQKHLAAGMRLADMLDMQPGTRLYVASEQVPVLQLVNVDIDDEVLVAAAQQHGPGIEETQLALMALQEQLELSSRLRFAPSVGVDLGYGAFGGGVGSSYRTWGDRADAGVHVYWDLSEFLRGGATRRVFEAKRQETHLQQQKVLKALSLGIRVSLSQARSARERMRHAEQQIANEIYQYNKVVNLKVISAPKFSEDSDPSNVQQVRNNYTLVAKTIGELAAARSSFLDAAIEWNKAQITLNFLTGACAQHVPAADVTNPVLPPPNTETKIPDNGNEAAPQDPMPVIEPPAAAPKNSTEKFNAGMPSLDRIAGRAIPIAESLSRKNRQKRPRGPYPLLPIDD